ncbi:ribosomal RNA processing protein 36 homolog [Terrapene carolina triunguis]|uniref:rRNA biogenesis protein RRP36 n=1 Tax=Terrapene triunguis TaxID=2587831 RepID=A0A674J928_9SAUR|nr:ribosomal RNA processing protein 36 homolog [Terrapene carolina triunguis]
MMWPRQDRPGNSPRKNVSSFGKGVSRGMHGKRKVPATETVEESAQDTILDAKLVTAQKQPLESSSGIAGISGECNHDAKKPRLLQGESATDQGAVSEDSEDSDGNSDYSDLEDFSGDDDDKTGSGTAGSSDEEPCAGGKDISKFKTTPESDTKRELSLMSFEELLQLRNSVGTKAYQQMTSGKKPLNHTKPRTKQRPSKQGPLEISAKKPVPFLRQVVSVKKTVQRDPRFDDLSGEYNPEIFEKTYSFLNGLKKREKEIVQKQLKKSQNVEQQEKLQQLLKRMTQQEEAQKERQRQREKELALKRAQREQAQLGRKPFYLKKSEKWKLDLAEKYKVLKGSGKLESFLSKKRKRNAIKDKRRLPFRKNM